MVHYVEYEAHAHFSTELEGAIAYSRLLAVVIAVSNNKTLLTCHDTFRCSYIFQHLLHK